MRICSVCLAFVLGLFLFSGVASAGDLEKAAKPVQELIQKNGLSVVEYDYVVQAVADGTRKGAKALLIDARPAKKYMTGHIPSSINIPDTAFDKFYFQMDKVDKNKEIIIYCGGFKCEKSPLVGQMLKEKGFTNIKIYIAGEPEWSKKSYIEVDTPVVEAAYKSNGAFIIDARPYKKFLGSTIPGSVSIPDTQMDTLMGRFPANKAEQIITFCGGYGCEKSHIVAHKLIELGYTNVKVYAAGEPEWSKLGLQTTGGGSKPAAQVAKKAPEVVNGITKGLDEGTVDGKWFLANMSKLDNVQIVDVRPANNFAEGHIKDSINVYGEKLEAKDFVAKLPKDKVVVFICASGARALEAWEKAKEGGADLTKVFYFDANINCDKNNECKIEANEPLGV